MGWGRTGRRLGRTWSGARPRRGRATGSGRCLSIGRSCGALAGAVGGWVGSPALDGGVLRGDEGEAAGGKGDKGGAGSGHRRGSARDREQPQEMSETSLAMAAREQVSKAWGQAIVGACLTAKPLSQQSARTEHFPALSLCYLQLVFTILHPYHINSIIYKLIPVCIPLPRIHTKHYTRAKPVRNVRHSPPPTLCPSHRRRDAPTARCQRTPHTKIRVSHLGASTGQNTSASRAFVFCSPI
jgi:hypothetical protein